MVAVQRKYVYNTVSVGMYKFSKSFTNPLCKTNVTSCRHG